MQTIYIIASEHLTDDEIVAALNQTEGDNFDVLEHICHITFDEADASEALASGIEEGQDDAMFMLLIQYPGAPSSTIEALNAWIFEGEDRPDVDFAIA